jgi:molybdopterin converting factor small subunit
MKIRVKLFGPLADAADAALVEVDLPDDQVADAATVLRCLGASHPRLVPALSGARLAVNHRFALSHERVSESDELALIGMVSGG